MILFTMYLPMTACLSGPVTPGPVWAADASELLYSSTESMRSLVASTVHNDSDGDEATERYDDEKTETDSTVSVSASSSGSFDESGVGNSEKAELGPPSPTHSTGPPLPTRSTDSDETIMFDYGHDEPAAVSDALPSRDASPSPAPTDRTLSYPPSPASTLENDTDDQMSLSVTRSRASRPRYHPTAEAAGAAGVAKEAAEAGAAEVATAAEAGAAGAEAAAAGVAKEAGAAGVATAAGPTLASISASSSGSFDESAKTVMMSEDDHAETGETVMALVPCKRFRGHFCYVPVRFFPNPTPEKVCHCISTILQKTNC